MLNTILAVAAGGALGAVARYGVNHGTVHLLGHGFPWATVIVNIVGSFLMGILVAKFATLPSVSGEMKSFLITGFLGAFTTFSTFSLDFATLWERGAAAHALGYAIFSVIASITALFAALWLMRSVLS